MLLDVVSPQTPLYHRESQSQRKKMKIPSAELKKMKYGFIVYPKLVGLLPVFFPSGEVYRGRQC